MRILHLYKDYFPVLGGIENHIKVLAEAQARAGHDVTVLVCDPGHKTRVEDLNGVRVVKAGRLTTAASMPLSVRQPLALARADADIVHVHSPYPLGEASAWLLKRRSKIVITYHSDVVRQRAIMRIYGPLFRRVLRRTDRIIATSPRYVETSPWLSQVKEKCVVVQLGVDHRRFTPPAEPYDGPFTLLFVGRLRYYKGLDDLLQAMRELPGVRLRVVGIGPMLETLRAVAQELGVGDRVEFLGEVDDERLPELYRRAHLFVLPANARAEAFGTVLLEAMASGLPCVTTEVGTGTSWVVQDGVTGLVVPPHDPRSLAEAIRRFQGDDGLRRDMGLAARRRVESEFTQEKMVAGVQAVYDSLLG